MNRQIKTIKKTTNAINENQKGIDMLTKLIYKDVKKIAATETIEPVQENTPVTEELQPVTETTEPVQETTPVTEEIKEPTPVNEEVKTAATETPVTETQKPLSIWEQIKKPTQEDKTINTKQSTEGIADKLTSQANGTDNFANEENAQKQSNKVRAAIMVEIADVIFMFICLLLTWDFSDKNQAKFTLHKDRKAAIEHNLFKLYQVQNKKTEPKKEIFFLILGSYVPMLLVALFAMIKRLKDKSDDKKRAALIVHQNNEQLMNNTGNPAPNEEMNFELESTRKLNAKLMAELSEIRNNKNPVNTFGKGEKQSTGNRGVKAGTKRGSYKK